MRLWRWCRRIETCSSAYDIYKMLLIYIYIYVVHLLVWIIKNRIYAICHEIVDLQYNFLIRINRYFIYIAFQQNFLIACNILMKKISALSEYAEMLNELCRRKRMTSFLWNTLRSTLNLHNTACVTVGRNAMFTTAVIYISSLNMAKTPIIRFRGV